MKNAAPKIQMVDPNKLTPYANNAKEHPVAQIDKIAGQIAKFGFDQPIVVDKQFVIIKGHGRREASLRLGLKEVPVIVAEHLTEDEVMASRIGDNQVATLGSLNLAKLKFELGTLQRRDFELKATGFELREIEGLLADPFNRAEAAPRAAKVAPESEEHTPSTAATEEKAKTQFIVTVHCEDETEMQEIYEEMVERGLSCKLIT